jgi:hypothetical protein
MDDIGLEGLSGITSLFNNLRAHFPRVVEERITPKVSFYGVPKGELWGVTILSRASNLAIL